MRKQISSLLILAATLALFHSETQAVGDGGGNVLVVTINGAINPVTAEHIVRHIKLAEEDASVEALVIELDTPGGLDTSMREIVKSMQASTKPVVVYVAPSGSRAASAGAFITMAAHLAAMAPGTNIGAASPVNMGGGDMDETMKKKITNDAAAYIRSIAEAHGRDADWGEKFVRKGASISESEALKNNVVDILAESLPKLLQKIDGRKVKIAGVEREIKTAGAKIRRVEMTWRQKFFDAMANPNVAYILFMLGFYGLLFELYTPGAVLPGVIGAICIILALYSFQSMPINYAGALLILLAMIMFTLEVWVPSFGVLSIGGVVALLLGSLMLIDSPDEYLKLSLMVIIPSTLFTAGFFMFIIGAAMRALKRKTVIGKETMIGKTAIVESKISPDKPGTIVFEGDIWGAVSKSETMAKETRVVIESSSGLTLTVIPDKPTT